MRTDEYSDWSQNLHSPRVRMGLIRNPPSFEWFRQRIDRFDDFPDAQTHSRAGKKAKTEKRTQTSDDPIPLAFSIFAYSCGERETRSKKRWAVSFHCFISRVAAARDETLRFRRQMIRTSAEWRPTYLMWFGTIYDGPIFQSEKIKRTKKNEKKTIVCGSLSSFFKWIRRTRGRFERARGELSRRLLKWFHFTKRIIVYFTDAQQWGVVPFSFSDLNEDVCDLFMVRHPSFFFKHETLFLNISFPVSKNAILIQSLM